MNFFGHDLLALMASHGYLLLFAIIMLEEAGLPLPIPGDLFLLFTGSLVAQGILGLAPTLLILAIATLIGTSCLYTVALRGGRPLLRRYGRWLRLDQKRLDRAEQRLGSRPISGVTLLRLTPGLRIYSTVVTGLLAVPRPRATISFVLSGGVWASIWIGLGMLLGTNVNRGAAMISRVDRLLVPVFVIAVIAVVSFWLGRRAYRRYLPNGLALRRWVPRIAGHRRPRLSSATVSAIALALLLVTPPLIGTAYSIGERAEREVSVRHAVPEAPTVLLVNER